MRNKVKHSGIKVGEWKFRFGISLAAVRIDDSGEMTGHSNHQLEVPTIHYLGPK